MKLRTDLGPEDVSKDSTSFIIIGNLVYELETAEDQELFGVFNSEE